MELEAPAMIIELLRERYGSIDYSSFIATRVKGKSLFEFLVGVLLSQNTSDRNAVKAYEKLREMLGGAITPERVLKAGFAKLVKAIRSAGMYKQRSKKIMMLAKIFASRDYVDKLIRTIKNAPLQKARETLLKLPGVGLKTADVVLLMYFGKYTFPVDTHIMRITKRLRCTEKTDYEAIRDFWMKSLNPRNYLEAHLLLITHGREVCRARRPLCHSCVIRKYCNTYLRRCTES